MASEIDLGSVFTKLEMDISNFQNNILKAQGMLGTLNKTAKTTSFDLQSSAQKAAQGFDSIATSISGLLKPLVALGAVGSIGLGGLLKFGFDQIREIQKTTAGIKALTGSAEEAGRVISQMIEYVQGKPFDRLEVIAASRQLLAMGRSTQELTNDIELLGRAVVLTGGDFASLTKIYGVASSSNRIMSGELNQLEASGIPITLKLAEALGITAEQVRKLAEDGEIDFETFRKGLEKALPADIVKEASNTIDNKVKSLSASFRNLAFDMLGVDFSKIDGRPLVKVGGLLDNIINGIEDIIKKLRSPEMRKNFELIGIQIAKVAKEVVPKLIDAFVFLLLHLDKIIQATVVLAGLWAGFKIAGIAAKILEFGAAIGKGVQVMLGFIKTSGLVMGSLKALWAAFLTNPIGWAILAVAGLIAALVVLEVKFKVVTKAIRWLRDRIEPLLPIFQSIAKYVAGQFMSALESLKTIWSEIVKALQPAIQILKDFWQVHGAKVTTAIKGIVAASILLNPAVKTMVIVFATIIGSITLVAKGLEFLANNIEGMIDWFVRWRLAFYLLTGPIGIVIASLEVMFRAMSFFSKGAKNIADDLGTAGTAVGNFNVAVQDINVNGIAETKGKQFGNAFSKTFPEIATGLENSLSLDAEPIGVRVAVSLRAGLIAGGLDEALANVISSKTALLLQTATTQARQYANTWQKDAKRTAKDNGLSDVFADEIAEMGIKTKADAGLVGQEAADNIYIKLKARLADKGLSGPIADELAKGSPAYQLAAGRLGSNITTEFQKALKAELMRQPGMSEALAEKLSTDEALVNKLYTDLATQIAETTNRTVDEVMKDPTQTLNNMLLAGAPEAYINATSLGVTTADGITAGINNGLIQKTGTTGIVLATNVQNAVTVASPTATLQGNNLGSILKGAIVTGVSTDTTTLPLTVKDQIDNATSLNVDTSFDNGKLLGGQLSVGISIGVKPGQQGVANSLNTTIQGASNSATPTATSNGYKMGSAMTLGVSGGVGSQQGTLNRTTENLVVSSANNTTPIAVNNFTAVGEAVARGAEQGVRNKQSGFWGTVKNMADRAWNIAKDVLGIKSPSKRFAYLGKNVGLGFSAGIKSQYKAVAKASEGLADIATPNLSGMQNSLQSRLDVSDGRGVNTGNNQNVNIYGNINIRNAQDETDFLNMNNLTVEQFRLSRGMAV